MYLSFLWQRITSFPVAYSLFAHVACAATLYQVYHKTNMFMIYRIASCTIGRRNVNQGEQVIDFDTIGEFHHLR